MPSPPGRPERDPLDFRERLHEASPEDARYWNGKASTAGTLAMLSLALCWLPIVPIALGLIAWASASSDLGRLEAERTRVPGVKLRLQTAKQTGLTGFILGAALLIPCCLFRGMCFTVLANFR